MKEGFMNPGHPYAGETAVRFEGLVPRHQQGGQVGHGAVGCDISQGNLPVLDMRFIETAAPVIDEPVQPADQLAFNE